MALDQHPRHPIPGKLSARLRAWVAHLQSRAGEALEGPLALARGQEHTFLVLAAILIGIAGAYGAIAFRVLIRWSHLAFFGTGQYTLAGLEALPWWRCVVMPAGGGLLVGLVVWRFAPEVKGSGIPEVMEAVAKRGGAIRLRVVLTKAVAAALTIGSGGSAGREGPIVHIGAAIGSACGQFLQVSPQRMRTFVACGSASAIAATFNAPIAGALFAMEVVLGDLRVASMSPIVISSVVATVISRHHLGDFPAFEVPGYSFLSARELLLYGVLGLVAGLLAVLFIRLLYATSERFERTPIPTWLRPAVGGLGVGVLGIAVPHVFGVGYETINGALWGELGAGLLAAVLLAKLAATALSLGSGGSGGVFAPSLFVGATLGAAFGQVVHGLFPGWTAEPGAYALVGMGAVVSATTHAPIAAILIIFELTNDYRTIAPLMLACVVSVLVSSQLHKESIYTEKLARRGVRLAEGRDINLLRAIQVKEAMDASVQCVSAELPLADVLAGLLGGSRPSAIVVDGSGSYLGSVELSDVREILGESEELASLVIAADVADTSTPYLVPGDSLDLAMRLFGRTHRDELPVCDEATSRRVLGVITRRAVIDAYNRRIFQADLAGEFHSVFHTMREGRTVEVLPGLHLSEIEVPGRWVGRTLREVDPRGKWGLEVVLVYPRDQAPQGEDKTSGLFPSPDLAFADGDRALVMGSESAIRRLRT